MLLAVEILSDGTRKVDRILKFAEYAEARIGGYWIVDLDEPASLRAFTLVGSDEPAYEFSGEFTGPVTLDVAGHARHRRPERSHPALRGHILGIGFQFAGNRCDP